MKSGGQSGASPNSGGHVPHAPRRNATEKKGPHVAQLISGSAREDRYRDSSDLGLMIFSVDSLR